MPTSDKALSVSDSELDSLFSGFLNEPVLLLAASGGPDSTALMLLAARWRDARKKGPALVAVTVDHGLRKEAKAEAAAVAKLARKLNVAHRIVRWTGKKPKTGLQQAARNVRYRLLAEAARKAKASHILTAHTRDDQAETVLIRMSRGSGLTGLGAMARIAPVPGAEDLTLARPLLDLPKARLVATLKAAKVAFADDPSNRMNRFTRARLRGVMPMLAEEGLTPARLALLARRLRRADAALEQFTSASEDFYVTSHEGGVTIDDAGFLHFIPHELGLRVLGRAVSRCGTEGPVELAKLEALWDSLQEAKKARGGQIRRTLAGAIVTLSDGNLTIEPAPPRRGGALTKRRQTPKRRGKAR